MRMKRIFKVILWTLAAIAAAFVAFLAVGAATDYRPDEVEVIFSNEGCASDVLPDSLKIVTWNIGYGGLGDNMDFFYDGGNTVRDTRERTLENLSSVVSRLKEMDADIYLLQEVDECSKRTYRINEVEMLRQAFPDYDIYLGYNYKSFFVPIPVREPIGKVAGGVVIMSRYRPDKVERYSYPSRFPFPVSMFNLKRCLLLAEYTLADGSRVVIGNTHNTAYDTGGMRSQEIRFLTGLLRSFSDRGVRSVIGGDWNQHPAAYLPSDEEVNNEFFQVESLPQAGLDSLGRVLYDVNSMTLRYLNEPFGEGSIQTVTDYFFVSDGIEASAPVCEDLRYRNTDHHPVSVVLRF